MQVELPQMMSKEASRSIWLLSHNDEKPGIQAIEIKNIVKRCDDGPRCKQAEYYNKNKKYNKISALIRLKYKTDKMAG